MRIDLSMYNIMPGGDISDCWYPNTFFIFELRERTFIVRYGDLCGWSIAYLNDNLNVAFDRFKKFSPNKICNIIYLEEPFPSDEEIDIAVKQSESKVPDFKIRRGIKDLDVREFLKKYIPSVLTAVNESPFPENF